MAQLNLYNANQVPGFSGDPLPNTQLSVYREDLDFLAPLFGDPHLTVTRPNPVRPNAAGQYPSVYLLEGVYRIEIRNHREELLLAQGGISASDVSSAVLSLATVAELLADETAQYVASASDGDVPVVEGETICVIGRDFHYEVAGAGATDHDLITAGGVKLYALPESDNFVAAEQFGAVEGFDPSVPSSNNALAPDNTVAIQKALDACRSRCLSGVRLTGRGYVVNELVVHEGITLAGATMNNEHYSNVKTPRTVVYQPQGYTANPLLSLFDDSYGNNQWGATLRDLHLKRDGSAGTLLEIRGGARAEISNVDLVGGDLGMIADGTQDSHFSNIRRSNGVRGVELRNVGASGQTDTTHFYHLWIESCTGLGLRIQGGSTSNMANGIEFFGLKLEGRPTTADELLYMEDVTGIQVHGLVKPGGGANVLSTDFSCVRIAGLARGVFMRLLTGNNNYEAAINSLVKMELDSGASRGITGVLSGTVTGAGSVGAIIDYGDSGHQMPNNSHFDCSGLEIAGGVVTDYAKSDLAYQMGNTIQVDNMMLGHALQQGHPLVTNGQVQRWVSPDGARQYDVRATNGGLYFYAENQEVMQWLTNGKLRLREPEFFQYPWKLGGNTIRTRAQAVANNPNPASFRGGVILISDATPANRPAYSDGTDWRYFSDNAIVS